MRRLILSLISVLVASGAFAASPAIRDIDINLDLREDGSVLVTEVWDVTVTEGTEWYLVDDLVKLCQLFGRVGNVLSQHLFFTLVDRHLGRCGAGIDNKNHHSSFEI